MGVPYHKRDEVFKSWLFVANDPPTPTPPLENATCKISVKVESYFALVSGFLLMEKMTVLQTNALA
jgi:hypothetical protein